MKTITNITQNEIIIKNSKFITILFPINDNTKIDNLIDSLKKQYPKANHYCYAYVLNNYQKANDDGEPSGTAGMPILNVLLKEKIFNVLAVTIRYFGGIKLGAGGLIRAYTKSVKLALDNSNLVTLKKGYKIKVTIPYNEQKNFEYLLKDYQILKKEFNQNITYEFLSPSNKLQIIDKYNYEILNEEYIREIKEN